MSVVREQEAGVSMASRMRSPIDQRDPGIAMRQHAVDERQAGDARSDNDVIIDLAVDHDGVAPVHSTTSRSMSPEAVIARLL